MTEPQVDPSYLADVTGKLPTESIDDFVKKTGLLDVLPASVRDAYTQAKDAQGEEVHGYLCNLDKEADRGQKNSCSQSKAWTDYNRKLSAANGDYLLEFELISPYPFRHGAAGKGLTIAKPANRAGKNLKGVDGRFQRVKPRQQRKRYHTQRVDTSLSKAEAEEVNRFAAAVNGEEGRTIGQKAIFYEADGTVSRGTGAIARDAKEVALSASSATLNQTTGTAAGAKPTPAPTAKAANHPNKKRAGETSGNFVAGLGAIGLVAVAIAALMPLHFVTSAITFVNSLVTFFTTTRNAIATYTSIVDAALGLFGIKKATSGFKNLIAGMIDGAFGKENVQYAQNAFAQTLNSVSSAVKVAEKIQSARSGTDNKIDEMAVQLGIVNNGLKDSGLMPPESPYMRQSAAVDQFVKDRTAGEDGVALADNLSQITAEIKTGDEVKKELADIKASEAKARKKIDKQVDDTARLVDGTKTNIETIQRETI
jgi:hypothetical protein